MASIPITSWQIEGGSVEVVTDFLFLGSETTMGGDCSCEIRRWLLLDLKAMINLDSVLKSRGITLPTKAVVFPVGTCGCENRTIKKAEHWRIDAFELWCWRRPLKAPWTARRSNQSILREVSEWVKVAQSCLTLCDPMDYTVHGILQNTGVGSLFLL